MIEELISRVFLARNKAHLAHWLSKSYSEHMALGEFYEGVQEAIDPIVENHIGQFGDGIKSLPAATGDDEKMIDYLREEADWIEVNRMEIASDSNAIAALVDDLTAVYLKAIYKLENLK